MKTSRDWENWAEPINLEPTTLRSLDNLAGRFVQAAAQHGRGGVSVLRFSRVICGHRGALCAITTVQLGLERGAQHQRPDDGQRLAPQHLETRSHKQQQSLNSSVVWTEQS